MTPRLLFVALVLSLLIVVPATAGAAGGRRAVPEALVQQAASVGSARVIVRLNALFAPDAAMISAAHAAVQRQDIAAVRGALKAQLAASRHTIVREYDALPFLALEAGPDALALLEALAGLVLSVEEDRLSRPQLAQSVPVIQGPQAWAAGFDGSGTIVAVLDTGVQKTHPFLSGKVVAEACFSTNGTVAGPFTVTSLCPGGVTTSTASGSGVNCPSTVEGCDHGTHVAGIVAGGTTGTSGAGVAPGASIMAIQVFTRFPAAHPACGGTACALSFSSDQLAALNHVFNQRDAFAGKTMASINMSLGGGAERDPCPGDPLATPIAQLKAVGIATVIATGNDGFTDAISSPACVPDAISVGSTGDGSLTGAPLDHVSGFSNVASFMSVLAPGQWILSSVPTTTAPSGFANFAGTSMATPHVAGAFAIFRQANPTASVDTFLSALQTTGEVVTDDREVCPTCESNAVTSHRINIMGAITVIVTPDVAVTAASTVAAAAPGQTITVNSTVTNVGPIGVGAFTVRYFLSVDTVFDDSVDVFVGGRPVTSLAAGAQNITPKTLAIPADTAPGVYRILVVADSADVLAESNESNNVRATGAIVVGLDVTITAASTVAAASPGQVIVVNSTVKNRGSVATGTFSVRYYLSTDAVFNSGDVVVGTRTMASMAPGAQDTTPRNVTIPSGTAPGIYRILVRADSAGVLAEVDETNNVKATAAVIIGLDLTVTAATTVATASPGAAIVVDSTIRNIGSTAAGSFLVRYYLSTNGGFDAADVVLGTRTVASLAAGASDTTPRTVTLPMSTAAGTYRILVRADSAGALAEVNENNNVKATAAVTIGP